MTLTSIVQLLENIPDFPKKGIQFKDISGILENSEAFTSSIDLLAEKIKHLDFDTIISIDARGFIFGSALAYKLNKSLVMARKKGKLPGNVLSQKFEYEYDSASLELQSDRIKKGAKYLIIDDVLATGNTAKAVIQLLNKTNSECAGLAFFIELEALKGREILIESGIQSDKIISLITE